jgi:hypothetical protein
LQDKLVTAERQEQSICNFLANIYYARPVEHSETVVTHSETVVRPFEAAVTSSKLAVTPANFVVKQTFPITIQFVHGVTLSDSAVAQTFFIIAQVFSIFIRPTPPSGQTRPNSRGIWRQLFFKDENRVVRKEKDSIIPVRSPMAVKLGKSRKIPLLAV